MVGDPDQAEAVKSGTPEPRVSRGQALLTAIGEHMNRLIASLLGTTIVIISLVAFQRRSEACQRSGPVVVSQTCKMAEYIVRATAVEYSQSPQNPTIQTTGIPDSKVIFNVEEVLKGDSLTSSIDLNGYLTDKDDFNDQPVPYNFVRPGGRRGSCFANTYKKGAQFLLFLERSDRIRWPRSTATFTVDIDALAPVNEQLHSSYDPWLYYVKGVLDGMKELSKEEKARK